MSPLAPASTTRHTTLESPVGPLTVVRDDAGYTGLYFPGHWTRPDRGAFGPLAPPDDGFAELAIELAQYFTGERVEFTVPLAVRGTALQLALWRLLAQIPHGDTTTYGALTARLGGGFDARDIGALVGQNPLSIVVPCHRVVGADGRLTGYAGGLRRKRFLLELEGALPAAPPTLW